MKIKFIIFCIFFLLIPIIGCTNGSEEMYIALYDKNLDHIVNLTDVEYDYTRRVFDMDSGEFSGSSASDALGAFLFVLLQNDGTYVYAGFVKNIVQTGKTVKFTMEDFKKILDTEILLDYTDPALRETESRYQLHDVIEKITDAVEAKCGMTIFVTVGADTTDTSWIAVYDGTYFFANALAQLKPYLAYYGYLIYFYYYANTKTIAVYVDNTTATQSIRLEDFTFEITKTPAKTNNAIATIKYDAVDKTSVVMMWSDEIAWGNCNPDLQFETDITVADPNTVDIHFADPLPIGALGICQKVNVYRTGFPALPERVLYFEAVYNYTERPSTWPFREYYLGNDNLIYANTISAGTQILPVQTKYFEAEYLSEAQFKAVSELTSNMYVESIIIDATTVPVNLSTVLLYTLFTVYDSIGVSKVLPVSEIQNNNGNIKIKLGFKKTLFTEIVKGK